MRGHFGWEYKGKKKDLKAAYAQLLQYRESLENPKLLVVCDMDRFEVHTNFNDTPKKVYTFDLAGLADPKNLDILRRVFTDPESLKPGVTREGVTKQAAERFGQIADGMRVRKVPSQEAAHFLMKLIFCMFAEDIELLPNQVFSRLLAGSRKDPTRLGKMLSDLFEAMSNGGTFGTDDIAYFNGGLFADAEVIPLLEKEINVLVDVVAMDWGSIEPSIFGTLFERLLDPDKRAQIGAHYTSRGDIETIVNPVVMVPLRREWDDVRRQCEALIPKFKRGKTGRESKVRQKFDRLLLDFMERLADVTVLDPACGSGNFLYVTLRLLLELGKEVYSFGRSYGIAQLPRISPTQLHGLDINRYAQELAQVAIWIGYLQWLRDNGFTPNLRPVLEPIESIQHMDAILDLSDPQNPKEPTWPAADFIVGNPPFLGGKLLRSNLGDEYVDAMFRLWGERVRPEADLCCYWFEKARSQVKEGKCRRAGLLATQGIRGGANRDTLARIKESGGIFFAESDRDWILNGANVHVSMVGFDDGTEKDLVLDGHKVRTVNANLSAAADITQAARLTANLDISYMGDTKGGAFDITAGQALQFLRTPTPHGRPNSDVVLPWANGLDITRRNRGVWIIDFGTESTLLDASQYEAPFEYVRDHVYPERQGNKRESYRKRWWLHVEPRSGMRAKLAGLSRFLITTTVSKHRLFLWAESPTLPDHQLIVLAAAQDCFLGVLHSRVHEVWGLRLGTRLETRPRYTPTTCFETFPFPKPADEQRDAIAEAAQELDRLRSNWLNPPEWTREEVLEFPGSTTGPWARYVHEPDHRGIGTVRYPRLVPKDAECAKELKQRTLTELYNRGDTWLSLAHQRLDAAVFAAYGWDPAMTDDDLLAALLALNLERAQA
jgi:type II restriction/modification system DNA methylase subunit YeeA